MKKTTQPPDLSQPAIKAARRLQALEAGRVYVVRVVKMRDGVLVLSVRDEGKAEVCR